MPKNLAVRGWILVGVSVAAFAVLNVFKIWSWADLFFWVAFITVLPLVRMELRKSGILR